MAISFIEYTLSELLNISIIWKFPYALPIKHLGWIGLPLVDFKIGSLALISPQCEDEPQMNEGPSW